MVCAIPSVLFMVESAGTMGEAEDTVFDVDVQRTRKTENCAADISWY